MILLDLMGQMWIPPSRAGRPPRYRQLDGWPTALQGAREWGGQLWTIDLSRLASIWGPPPPAERAEGSWRRLPGGIDMIDLSQSSWMDILAGFQFLPGQIYRLLLTLDEKLRRHGARLRASPGLTGWNLLEQMHRDTLKLTIPSMPEWGGWEEGWRAAAPEVIFQFDVSPRPGRRLIKYDRRGAYLYAAGSADSFFGAGSLLDVGQDEALSWIESNWPGAWLVYLSSGNPLRRERWTWLTTPHARAGMAGGWIDEIARGYRFERRGLLLQRWAKRLEEWRDDAQGLERAAWKLVANAAIGYSARAGRADVRAHVIGYSVERMTYSLSKIKQAGWDCWAVYMDSLFLIEPPPGYGGSRPPILRNSRWKREWALLIDEEVAALLKEPVGLAKKLAWLNRRAAGNGREQGDVVAEG